MRRLLILLLAGCEAVPLAAQKTSPRPYVRPSRPDTALTVYLMTMGPGKRVWERFGHNAIWIHDPISGTDQAYNYGIFDFRQHNFLLRFIQGHMWYRMQGAPAQAYLELYRRDNRSVWVQQLEMSQASARELQAFLEWNDRPENRYYRYDYYRDNCSTRVRDALDRALGGVIRRRTESQPTARTYRFHTLRLTANDPPTYTGLLIALGHPVDRPISVWEEMFLPLAMREHFRTLTVTGTDGVERRLVKSERTLFEASEPIPPEAPPFWLPAYLALGVLIGAASVALAGRARSSRPARWGFLTISLAWVLVTGVAGLVLAGLWGLTDHAAAYRNENLLQANFLALPLLWLIPRAPRKGRGRSAWMLAALVAGLSLVGLVLKLLPQFYQVNGSVIALALPAHAGLALALWRTRHSERSEESLLGSRRNPSLRSG